MEDMKSILRRKAVFLPIVIVVLSLLSYITFSPNDTAAIATTQAQEGPFQVSIKTSGEIRAANSFTLTVPRSRYGQVQIVYLIPEGTTVQAGEVAARFSTTEVDKTIQEKDSELGILRSDLVKMKADQEARLWELDAAKRNAELAHSQAQLQMEKMKFEAEMARKEAEINLEKSRLSFEQAKRKIVSQGRVDKSDTEKARLKILQVENDLARARQDKDMFTLKAPMQGLVVYEMNWSTGRKVNVGDSPWPGMAIISLPDLSKMQAITNINEVDISKVKKDQQANIRLDAFADMTFPAKVVSVGTIGQQRDRNSGIKTFEVILDIVGSDPALKPGMTTSNEIVMETIPQAVFIPLESVFEKNGKLVVYKMNGGSPEATEVQIGAKNSNFVVIANGLNAGEKVTLRDPTEQSEEKSKPGPAKEARL
ncbi:MAG: hypothetical protein A3C56_10790 [Ignavibacteria bacterium RIFCSPHIGHO2_02_FULL_56_12]|nr:MAG: hypothetical protein A3C56_10790 [Ignavibacteria bacterium RIFCSPHIGHO2_02_FULL_56_12]